MTNEFGSDHPSHEDVHPEAEAWPDNQPPVDDFADPQAPGEEAAMVSQETEAEAEEMPPAGGHSRSMFLPLAAGVGGLLVLAAVVYWQFGRASQPPIPPMVMMAQTSTQKGSSPPLSLSNSSPSMPAAGNNGLDNPYKGGQESASSAGIAETAPKTSMAAIPEAATPGIAGSPAGIATPVALNPPSVAASVPASSLQAAPVSAGNAIETRLDALTVRIDDLQKQLNQVTTMIANQASPAVAGSITPAIEDRFNKIEQNLLALKHDQLAKEPVATAEAIAPPPLAPAMTEKTVRVKSRSEHKKTASAHKRRLSSVKVVSAPHWILRAATPNEAWVSAGATSPELRHLQVGDVLPGIGRVRAIRQGSDGWVVEGTAGTIH